MEVASKTVVREDVVYDFLDSISHPAPMAVAQRTSADKLLVHLPAVVVLLAEGENVLLKSSVAKNPALDNFSIVTSRTCGLWSANCCKSICSVIETDSFLMTCQG